MNIFKLAFPDKYFGCRVFSENVLSISLNYNSVGLSLTKFSAGKKVVTSVGSYSLEGKPLINKFGEFDQTTINSIFTNIKEFCAKLKVDKIILIVPSNICVFKEIEVPFRDKLKIESIIEMQIDGLLPADPQNMSFDFVLWPQGKDGVNRIFLAALESKNLASLAKVAAKNAIDIDLITVDAFCYSNAFISKDLITENQAILLVVGEESSKIIFIKNKCINFVKNLQVSYDTIFENIGKKLELSPLLVAQKLLQFETQHGEDNPELAMAFKAELEAFVNLALWNIDSVSSKIEISSDKIYVLNDLPYSKLLFNLIAKSGRFVGVEIPPEGFVNKYNVKNRAVFGAGSISKWQLPIISALIYDSDFDFNVGQKVLTSGVEKKLQSKFYILIFLLTILFGYLFYIASLRVSSISSVTKVEAAIVVGEIKKNLQELGVTVSSRLDHKKLLLEFQKTISDLSNTAFVQDGIHPNFLELIFSITKCMDKFGQKIVIQKVKFYIEPEQKSMFYKLKGAFEKSQTKDEAERFFNLLRVNLKYDSYELKQKESSNDFTVTFVKKNE